MTGKLITLEGPEGSGKSTQAALLAEALEALGKKVVVGRDPGGTPVGDAIRNLLQHDSAGEGMPASTEILLFEASRAALVESVIIPALESGTWAICDRFTDSTLVYQGYGRGHDVEVLKNLNNVATSGLTPDLTVMLDVDTGCGFERIREHNSRVGSQLDRMERESAEFHAKVRRGYLEVAGLYPDRCVVIDGSQGVDDVKSAIWELVNERLLKDHEA